MVPQHYNTCLCIWLTISYRSGMALCYMGQYSQDCSGVWVTVLSRGHIRQGHCQGLSVGIFLWLKLLLDIKKTGSMEFISPCTLYRIHLQAHHLLISQKITFAAQHPSPTSLVLSSHSHTFSKIHGGLRAGISREKQFISGSRMLGYDYT